jgi:hypothetical protein
MDPAEEARMEVAHAIGQDEPQDIVADPLRALRLDGERLGEGLLDGVGNGDPHGTVADLLDVPEGLVEHAMAERPERVPVGRVERSFPV